MRGYISLARPKNWLKNVFIFVSLVFSLDLFNLAHLINTVVVFFAFCLVASAVYAFNDICDAGKDALHPVKRFRPIPSGMLSKQKAAVFAAVLVAAGTAVSMSVSMLTVVLIAAYILINISYSLWLKQIPVVDCFCIAAGFVLRVYIGAVAIGEFVSDWLFLTVVAMSLFMAFGKRRGDAVKTAADANLPPAGEAAAPGPSAVETAASEPLAEAAAVPGGKAAKQYSLSFLQGMVFSCAGLSVVFYSLWAMMRGFNMIFTVPLIIFIVAKYLMLIFSPDSYGDPTTVIFGDKILLVSAGLYAVLVVVLLYTGSYFS